MKKIVNDNENSSDDKSGEDGKANYLNIRYHKKKERLEL